MSQQSIAAAQQSIIAEFTDTADWEDRYSRIIDLGKKLPDIPADFKTETFRVKGCQSTVYLHPEFRDGKVFFEATSDAMIVSGLIALLLRVYSGRTPEEIISTPPEFVQGIGLNQNLTMGRANGLRAMIEQMKLYALAYKTMAAANTARQ